jgi:hypothetical protein
MAHQLFLHPLLCAYLCTFAILFMGAVREKGARTEERSNPVWNDRCLTELEQVVSARFARQLPAMNPFPSPHQQFHVFHKKRSNGFTPGKVDTSGTKGTN